MDRLTQEFEQLGQHTEALIELLEEVGDPLWPRYFKRGLAMIRERRLAGATYILGCYGGHETFSDLTIGAEWLPDHPLKYEALNARLGRLRTAAFESASLIASRKLW